MVIVYGNGRATGKHAEIALELKRRRQSFGTDDDLRETIDNIDNLISTQENHDVIGDEYIDVMASPGTRSHTHFDNPSSLTNKRKNEIWNILEEIGIDSQATTISYLYFIENPEKVRAIFGCPLEKRKKV
ncbi:hypothetical protein J1N35_014010 [Gossypium stocksii]|uniref:Uncharacterized protein n=1 Tax=Gossypium stocksii TaxID=47602 RepID=A0A9D3VV28_9ROSI|nr:hypothetical protein J1N35_014010 [Gossypium stocksii]